jgi:hypothetical protein
VINLLINWGYIGSSLRERDDTDRFNIPVLSFDSIARSAPPARLTRSINQAFTSGSALLHFPLATFDPLAVETRIDTRACPFSDVSYPRRSAPLASTRSAMREGSAGLAYGTSQPHYGTSCLVSGGRAGGCRTEISRCIASPGE